MECNFKKLSFWFTLKIKGNKVFFAVPVEELPCRDVKDRRVMS